MAQPTDDEAATPVRADLGRDEYVPASAVPAAPVAEVPASTVPASTVPATDVQATEVQPVAVPVATAPVHEETVDDDVDDDDDDDDDDEPIVETKTVRQPKEHGNRAYGTGVVLLSSLIFEIVYLAAIAVYVLVEETSTAQFAQTVLAFFKTPLGWLPVVLFVVFFELTVLLFNRAGRFAYVISSIIVGLLVFFGSIIILLQSAGQLTNASIQQAVVYLPLVLAGLAAREVMLWAGLFIGARGKRVRTRNKAERADFEHEAVDVA